jgi:UDP:flavonoid glycosyltransferase YjiC (YdhE family)
LAERDARLVGCVREAWVASDAQGMAPQDVAELFTADAQLICAWPEVDPFGPREGVEYLGPQADEALAQALTWQGQARPRIVAYLKPRDPRFELARRAIGRAAGEAVIAAPDLNARQAEALSSGNIRVVPGPVRLDLLEDADLCVSHGGPGIVWAAMRQGVPQALLPLQLEQYLVSRRAVAAGIAALLEPGEDHPDIDAWLRQALDSPTLRGEAQDIGGELCRRTPANAGERIARGMKA